MRYTRQQVLDRLHAQIQAGKPIIGAGAGTGISAKFAEAGGMRSLEVVEINTALDVNNRTAELGVQLILSALGKRIL